MPKASDLNLGDDRPQVDLTDAEHTRQREDFLDGCRDLLDDDRYAFASSTIIGMRDRVQDGMRPTDRMWRALSNIREGGKRQRESEKNWGRRYEGR